MGVGIQGSGLTERKKVLVAYFSHSGNTREIAEEIHENVGGGIFEIKAAESYPHDYDAVVKRAKQELDPDYRAELKAKIENIESYDMIFIGYPNWCGTIPAPVGTFLWENDFSGKTIIPFCTHEGSGFGRSISDISKLCPESALLDGISIRGRDVKTARKEISEWLRTIKIGDKKID